ncbi:hypothetical protein A2Z33_01790 [Candidatus Gottesmanbacteria bacterium RBG_16_52_11]|uniref:Uncharacterized protein n=1 Tax=Candidatus Gottesmanbacteria bacterium RBG_16_52_11 TaxID=1798374 RepID=A0A1F5YQN9_9BACT|nr:MAG: hypothetical protein A2Z33_01790 [Candidatus Gottesmanbacteria bacterium RBG_16_52_11]
MPVEPVIDHPSLINDSTTVVATPQITKTVAPPEQAESHPEDAAKPQTTEENKLPADLAEVQALINAAASKVTPEQAEAAPENHPETEKPEAAANPAGQPAESAAVTQPQPEQTATTSVTPEATASQAGAETPPAPEVQSGQPEAQDHPVPEEKPPEIHDSPALAVDNMPGASLTANQEKTAPVVTPNPEAATGTPTGNTGTESAPPNPLTALESRGSAPAETVKPENGLEPGFTALRQALTGTDGEEHRTEALAEVLKNHPDLRIALWQAFTKLLPPATAPVNG